MERELKLRSPATSDGHVPRVPIARPAVRVFASSARPYEAGAVVHAVQPRPLGPEAAEGAPDATKRPLEEPPPGDCACAVLQSLSRRRAEREGRFGPAAHVKKGWGSRRGENMPVTVTAGRRVAAGRTGQRKEKERTLDRAWHVPRPGLALVGTCLLVSRGTPRGQKGILASQLG